MNLPDNLLTLIIVVAVSTVVAKVTSFILRLILIGILILLGYLFITNKVNASETLMVARLL